ncbi:MAG: TfoX/Sxy family protein [Hyphomicrobiaceae bacterium]
MSDSALRDLLDEVLAPLGPVSIKRMFGGYGLFLDGLMFGLVSGGQLYFKTGESDRDMFKAEGLGPFTYTKKGETAVLTSYWQAPERLLDDPDEMVQWARTAIGAARRAQTSAKPRKGRSTAKPARASGGSE